MKYVTVYEKGTDEVLASFEERDDGTVIGITRDDIAVIVDGKEMKSSAKED